MNFPSIDVRTVVLLMSISNIFTAGILATQDWNGGRDRKIAMYINGKLILAAAFLLLGLRDFAPEFLTIYLANVLIFIGFTFEAVALGKLFDADPRLEKMLVAAAAVGTLAFLYWGHSIRERTIVVSVVLLILCAIATFAIASAHDRSRLRKLVLGFNAVMLTSLLLRVVVAWMNNDALQNGTLRLVETLLFVPTYLFFLLGGVLYMVMVNDQSERSLKAAHRELHTQKSLLQGIFDTSSVGIFLLDTEGRITLANHRMGELFGMCSKDMIGTKYVDYLDVGDREHAQKNMHELLKLNIPDLRVQRKYLHKNGPPFWGHLSGTRFFDDSTNQIGLIGAIADINELKQAEEHIRNMALHDSLTGLANRSLFSDYLKQAIALAQRNQTLFAVAFLDLDNFKPVNDHYGHAVGDRLLQQCALRIQACTRESDVVARIGGDEFILLLQSIESHHDATTVAEKIRASISEPFLIHGQEHHITCSIGIAIYPFNGEDEIALTKSADEAMYKAKAQGRDQSVLS